MKFSWSIPSTALLAAFATLFNALAISQENPQPAVIVDLKPLGAAADLFAAPHDSKYQQRGTINLFWLDNDRLAVAFSSNRRWTNSGKPEPLDVRLIILNRAGKQLNQRNWLFGAEGPAGQVTLDLVPGPENSILAIHESTVDGAGAPKIPEGNFVQVLNHDASLRQNFYIPSTSSYVPGNSAQPGLVQQTFYADKHSSLAWWSGRPLQAGVKMELSKGREPVLAGPGVAAQPMCTTPSLCSGIRVFRSGAAPWTYKTPGMEFLPIPRLFLSPSALLVELRYADQKQGMFFVAHQDGTSTQLATLPKGQQVAGVSGVSSDGQRFSVDTGQEVGLCGGLDLFCRERGNTLIFDIPSNKIIFQQEISANGGVSAISPDGHQVAIFDRNKVAIYTLP